MSDSLIDLLAGYPLLDALRHRRSRRFGTGMKMPAGPMSFHSRQRPLRLSEKEEALLAFAACGVTGYALGDLVYSSGGGGSIMAGTLGRTVASGDAIQTVSVFVINDEATYLLKRPRDFPLSQIPELVRLSGDSSFVELYRKSRVKIRDGRSQPLPQPFQNLRVNQWSLYDPASTYFLPVNELTLMYINGLLEIFNEDNAAFVVDERAHYRPAGIKRFTRSRGGHLNDDARAQRTLTIQQLETLITEFVTVEQGMVLQNLALMTQAIGLGGFPHWAAHPFGWLQALGFRMKKIPGTGYLGLGWLPRTLARLLGREVEVGYGMGLEREGVPLLTPFCPPYFASMEAAVRAVVDLKYGPQGIFRGAAVHSAWRDPSKIVDTTEPPSGAAIDATIALCSYIYRRYGRFPAYQPAFRTVLGFQASHLDLEFYETFYRPEALSETQRRHMARWHGGTSS